MSTGWIDAVALVQATDIPLSVKVLERHASGLDASYDCDDHLLVLLDSDEDEVWFRIAALDETTIGDIHPIGERVYLVPASLSGDMHRWIDGGLFEGTMVPFTKVRLELRCGQVLRQLELALDAERASFVGGRPEVCMV